MRTPPRLAHFLLGLLPHELREHVTGDLVQEYQRIAEAVRALQPAHQIRALCD